MKGFSMALNKTIEQIKNVILLYKAVNNCEIPLQPSPIRVRYKDKDWYVASNLEFYFNNEEDWSICKNKMRWHLRSKTNKVIKINHDELIDLVKDIGNASIFLLQDLRQKKLKYNFLVDTSIYTETCRELLKNNLKKV